MPLRMEINPTYWAELNPEEKEFVIAHNCLHIIFQHPKRFRDFLETKEGKKENTEAWDKGVDVAVNEMLVNQFGFNREDFEHPSIKEGRWLDTVWPNEKVPQRKSADYYIRKCLVETPPPPPSGGGGGGKGEGEGGQGEPQLDDHAEFGEDPDESGESEGEELLDDMISQAESQEFLDQLSEEQKGEVSPGGREAGKGDGRGSWREVKEKKPPKKRKWETVIAHWVQKALDEKIDTFERWEDSGGRYSLLTRKSNVKLPFERMMNDVATDKTKVNLLFYLDTSGSCASFGERFFRAARTIPTDRFNVHLAFFDDIVVPTSLNDGKVRYGGGTNFAILEAYAKKLPQYPDAVFVITDGYGTQMQCSQPRKWHWFMTPHNTLNYIPKGCHTYDLADYE